MKKKKGVIININLSNRWLYTFILLGIFIMIGIGVYALTPGVKPNPGHLLSEVSPPAPCAVNQFLKFDGTNIVCSNAPTTTCPTCSIVYDCYQEQGCTMPGHYVQAWDQKSLKWTKCHISLSCK